MKSLRIKSICHDENHKKDLKKIKFPLYIWHQRILGCNVVPTRLDYHSSDYKCCEVITSDLRTSMVIRRLTTPYPLTKHKIKFIHNPTNQSVNRIKSLLIKKLRKNKKIAILSNLASPILKYFHRTNCFFFSILLLMYIRNVISYLFLLVKYIQHCQKTLSHTQLLLYG